MYEQRLKMIKERIVSTVLLKLRLPAKMTIIDIGFTSGRVKIRK